MIFVLSKVLNFFTSPINWILVLLVLWTLVSRKFYKRIVAGLLLAAVLIFTNGRLFDKAMQAWSEPYLNHPDSMAAYNIAIVAGGGVGFNPDLGQVDYNDRGDRITEAIRLYRLGRIKKLYLSGEAAFNIEDGRSYATEFLRYMKEMGVNPGDIILEQHARTTRENIINLQKMLTIPEREGPILLITSGWHIRRLLKGFRGSGLKLVPYAVDVPYTDQPLSWQDFLPSWQAAMDWQRLIHEMAGCLIVKS